MLMLICLTDMGCVLQNAEEVLQGLLAVQASLEDVTSDNDLQRLQQGEWYKQLLDQARKDSESAMEG